MKLGLERMEACCRLLNYPERAFSSIHVAGTNGKGSVAMKIAHALPGRVGLYTSPHLFTERERIQINGEMILEEEMIKLSSGLPPTLTYFERMTLIAFLYFRQERVDHAVIEVGLGGRLDATNVITPRLSVITSISEDHTALLGTTLEEIAFEKAGIIKPGIPVVLGPHTPKILEQIAQERGSLPLLVPHFLGSYDEENQSIARRALHFLGIETEAFVRPPCRFEEVGGVILDVAHNVEGFRRCFEMLGRKAHLLIGMSRDKDIRGCLKLAQEHALSLHFVPFDSERSADPHLLAELAGGVAYSSIEEGMEAFLKLEGPRLVMGSFFIMDRVLQRVTREGAEHRLTH